MYGGSHYRPSADHTAQGRSIVETARKFGDGKTLPFPPCKRYYNPYFIKDGEKTRMYACRLHHVRRKERVDEMGYRCGEKRLDDFWSKEDDVDASNECGPEMKSKKQK